MEIKDPKGRVQHYHKNEPPVLQNHEHLLENSCQVLVALCPCGFFVDKYIDQKQQDTRDCSHIKNIAPGVTFEYRNQYEWEKESPQVNGPVEYAESKCRV
ncbi:hypothetical protein SDC9_135224 [bioreactor metagenome]|uniref:Uncharacterized protein n=1 Tax=bioreactor metagenome TaxID=1076179 RepID=A0A645DH22_9ZZZZ